MTISVSDFQYKCINEQLQYLSSNINTLEMTLFLIKNISQRHFNLKNDEMLF